MSKYQTTCPPGRIQFHQWCQPPIEPADYTVTVHQKVDELGTEGEFDNEFKFSVAGPRFSLNPSEVYSVYPPKGAIGDFANTLPHVVFTRRTLPWERSVTTARDDKDKRPWMALLMFSASDFEPKEKPKNGARPKIPDIVPRKVGQLINPGPNDDWVGPKLVQPHGLQAYESTNDVCTTVDIPWNLFQATAPSFDDLNYLAHVREVNTDHKETSSMLADGWFSVVLANRFAEPERQGTEPPLAVENRVFLVSLEGLQDYLPGSGAADPNKANNPVRLAVLASWTFLCRKAFTFKSSMDDLDVARIGIPWNRGPEGGDADAKELVRAAYQRGYSALNHSTRLGEKAVSWYRGPLVPLYLTKQTNYVFRPAADAALRYDPLDGMMDVTYAGAFQLGRLLALQDRHFATSLYAYRTRVQRHLNDVLSKKRLQSVVGKETYGRERDIMSTYVNALGESRGSSPANVWAASEHEIADSSTAVPPANSLSLINDFRLSVPKNVCQWLGQLMLLYRVPFTYLVPDERMLPTNSIRFFYLDPGWVKCLLEGACSVGRASSRDELVDKELRDNFLEYAIQESRKVRTRSPKTGAVDGLDVKSLPPTGASWPQLTGFLLRSPVVEGWQGLEMRAWEIWKDEWTDVPEFWEGKTDAARKAADEDKERSVLTPVRLDRLGSDIMLCIFDGKVNYIEIKQPPEGMHFGAAKNDVGNGYTRLSLRSLIEDGATMHAADQIDDSKTPVRLRGNGNTRVVDVVKLAADLQETLKNKNAILSGHAVTSAEFGVEMVESPGRAFFDVNYTEKSNGGSK